MPQDYRHPTRQSIILHVEISGSCLQWQQGSWKHPRESPYEDSRLSRPPILRGAFTLSKIVLFVIGSPAQFRNRFRSLSNVNRSGSQNASKNAAAAAEKTE